MFYPKLAAGRQRTLTTEAFGGYDHNLELADGEFYDMENLSADEYPLLAPRPRRGTAQAIEGAKKQRGCPLCFFFLLFTAARLWSHSRGSGRCAFHGR